MAAMGHKQTISPILAECLLPGVKRTSYVNLPGTKSPAHGRAFGFPGSGGVIHEPVIPGQFQREKVPDTFFAL